MKSRTLLLIVTALASLSFSACSSNSTPSTTTPPPAATTYTIGGTVSGLTGTGLVLQDNGGDNLAVTANGAFTFATPIASGGAYAVTVLTQPSTPAQNCAVTSGSGTAAANVTNVQVACTVVPPTWTWVGGANVPNQLGTYGTQGVAAPTNVPGSRDSAISWTDASGNFWLFGGDSATAGIFNDLWEYGSGQWKWVSGSDVANQSGTYGTLGTAAPGNVPGARFSAVTWIDSSGTLWLFGGYGLDSTGSGIAGALNDLWKYSAGEWTWVSGSDVTNQSGIYGTLGTAAPGNIPGGRQSAVSWIDASGTFWLFGGNGYDSTGTAGFLNDLWKYSAGEWTWINGSNLVLQDGIYGTEGLAAPSNVPGARTSSMGWMDLSGNFWLFGGYGVDSTGARGSLNDLWKYSAGEWTWINGSNGAGQAGVYGTEGIPAPGNVPTARNAGVSWTDATGNFWLFGGSIYALSTEGGYLDDLWKYSAGQWTWMGGSQAIDQPPIYGTQGVASPSNIPGGRFSPANWIDSSGNLWLFGGNDLDNATGGELNDLWSATPN